MISKFVLLIFFVPATLRPVYGQFRVSSPSPSQQTTAKRIGTFPSLGRYVGTIKVTWNSDGRRMTLVDDFAYLDPDGVEWLAPKGSVTDGASIPLFAWSIIGGPFEGVYRDAAVVHDVACSQKQRSWESVHEMFYRAMLTSRVNEAKAKIMYAAVYHFGPRWELVRSATGILGVDKSAAVASVQSEVGSTNSKPDVSSKESPIPGTTDYTIRLVPESRSLSKREFSSLERMIKKGETAQPGSVTLEQIRNFRPTPKAH